MAPPVPVQLGTYDRWRPSAAVRGPVVSSIAGHACECAGHLRIPRRYT
ncbi:hypothetical protein COLINT_02619 [Collinsella intestinalis DSM 13280]|uniref:Uncharacterized protein n=1 Tax=Collinsella intestinalis DSM 13280 TaxID=521003 RepID=C4F984_9ACTN|nr:hypothetical protein COLINT_02619 [Collinsella intestinalis DSM 13280]